jgi:hypothetical protein
MGRAADGVTMNSLEYTYIPTGSVYTKTSFVYTCLLDGNTSRVIERHGTESHTISYAYDDARPFNEGIQRKNQNNPILGSRSAIRRVFMSSSPRLISIEDRGGTSQGADIRLWAIGIRPGYEYTFEFTGHVRTGTGNQTMFISAVTCVSGAGTNFAILEQVTTPVNETFTLSHTATYDEIRAHMVDDVFRYRLGGASRQNIAITGIRITEAPDRSVFNDLIPLNTWGLCKARYNYNETNEYDLNNRLLTTTKTYPDDSFEIGSFTYDNNGNQLTEQRNRYLQTRTYNALNQITQSSATTISGGLRITGYTYRADGLRHSKTALFSTPNAVTTTHVWDGANIVLERNSSGAVINR